MKISTNNNLRTQIREKFWIKIDGPLHDEISIEIWNDFSDMSWNTGFSLTDSGIFRSIMDRILQEEWDSIKWNSRSSRHLI